jgi:transcriptional regulator with XRE-family HTH domain
MIEIQKDLLESEEINLNEEKRESTILVSRNSLCRRLSRGQEARAKFVESHINKGISYQLRAMRESREWSQEQLASQVGMPQTAISRLESSGYGKPTITTLKRMARVYDVALEVRFVPFSKFVNRISGTPYIEHGLSSDALDVPSFEEELDRGYFVATSSAVNTNVPKRPIRAEQSHEARIPASELAGATRQQTISQARTVAQQGPKPLLVSEKVYSLAASAGD